MRKKKPLPPFPPQEYYRFIGYSVEKEHMWSDDFIGCWKIAVAQQIAKQLRKDGFTVQVRGRGPAPKTWWRIRRYGLPLKLATHGSVYIRKAIITEVKKKETEIDPRIAGMIETI